MSAQPAISPKTTENLQGRPKISGARLRLLKNLERKVLWLSTWMIHNANHLRPNRDGLKVGGHQASCASLATIMTALYFEVLRPQDRVAVKPHASPVFHAIQYLFGNISREKLQAFRAFGGAQSYPSRSKDVDDVDFSTGSVGLGVAMTSFAALTRDYLALKGLLPDFLAEKPAGRMIALMGDAELDEGNVFECLMESWKHDTRNLWWIIDYNRQSLDSVISDRLFSRIDLLFKNMGWRVVSLKYGKKLQAAFRKPGGSALRDWIDQCPNSLYSALVYQGGAAWRRQIIGNIGQLEGVQALIDGFSDAELAELMTNLAGHDLESCLEAFHEIKDDKPTCFIAYTIKGYALPFAGHKDNHAGLMNPEQMGIFQRAMNVPAGEEWEPYAGLDEKSDDIESYLKSVAFNQEGERRYDVPRVPVDRLQSPKADRLSTQEAFGRILADLAKNTSVMADRIVTTSPDVTVSTNLGGWVNRRAIFSRHSRSDIFHEQKVVSAQKWGMSPEGQHIELGIAENNLFINLAALGLSHSLFGARLLPIGTLYDPFISRGLDALNYACYQDARFIVVGTPSGITLAPEGGAHQSIATPLIGLSQDGLAAFEPAFADEVAVILEWAFDYLQRDGGKTPAMDTEIDSGIGDHETTNPWLRDERGGSVYLRLSTRQIDQPERILEQEDRRGIIDGGYWLKKPGPGCEVAIIATGAVMDQALAAIDLLAEDLPGVGLLAATSTDRLNAGWHAAQKARQSGSQNAHSHIERLLLELPGKAGLVTVMDGHPSGLEWIGAVAGHRVHSLGVEHFGQSGDIDDLYRRYSIDCDAIIDGVAALLIEASGVNRPH